MLFLKEVEKLEELINKYPDMRFGQILVNCDIIQDSYETLFLLLSTKDFSNIRQGSEIINILNTIILCLLTNFNKTL